METYQILLIVLASFILLSIIIFFIFKKKHKKDKYDSTNLNELIGFFGKDNIINVERTEKRVRIEVKDLSVVNLEDLNEYTNGVFTIGNKVVLTFKEKTEEIIEALKGLSKWKKTLL